MILKQFKLYPDGHWLFFEVFIHHTRKAMHKACKDCTPDFDGICRTWVSIYEKNNKNGYYFISRPKLGEIHMFHKRASVRIACHEICHAVHHYFWLRKRSNEPRLMRDFTKVKGYAGENEEAFCFAQGEMMRQYCVNYHRKTQEPIKRQKVLWPLRKGTRMKPQDRLK